jgi:small subunit ribosomal protein S1
MHSPVPGPPASDDAAPPVDSVSTDDSQPDERPTASGSVDPDQAVPDQAVPDQAAPEPVDDAESQLWSNLEKAKAEDADVTGRVTEAVKGGLILDVGVRAFLPASLVETRRVRDLQPYVGRTLEVKVLELNRVRRNVIVSRRAWLEQRRSGGKAELLGELSKGQIRKGVVSSVVAFGAFVDLGGVDGLVHVSELTWGHVDHPSEVVRVGQEVMVEVLDIDQTRGRVSLSRKATMEDPWRRFARLHGIGQLLPGKVTRLVPFGVFVRLDEGIEGLVHVSELADHRIEQPEQVVSAGLDVTVMIIDLDVERRRVALSLRRADEALPPDEDQFDPALYGLAATYDEDGNYIYPEGFDAATGDWIEGYEEQRAEWEAQYAMARERYDAHVLQVAARAVADGPAEAAPTATDEALAQLKQRLARGREE